jgi:hypothetical protein
VQGSAGPAPFKGGNGSAGVVIIKYTNYQVN